MGQGPWTTLKKEDSNALCDSLGLGAAVIDTLPPDLLWDVILGYIFAVILGLLFLWECKNRALAKQMGQFNHSTGDLKCFYNWGWSSMILSFLTCFCQASLILIFNFTNANCDHPVTEKINQTTGVMVIMAKFCSYTTQLFRLKSFFGGNKDTNKLAYPDWLFYILFFLIWADMIFLGIFWYVFVFYCGNCAPGGLGMPYATWFLPGLIVNDAFWFSLLFILFAFKIYQLSKIVKEQDGSSDESKAIRKKLNRSIQAILAVGLVSNGSSILFWTIGQEPEVLPYLGELAMADTLINSFCVMLIFEHNQKLLQKIYIRIIGCCCCWSKEKRDIVDQEFSFDPRNSRNDDQTHDAIPTTTKDVDADADAETGGDADL